MITQLGRLNPERLGVIARTSAMKCKLTRKTVSEIGRELGVSYVMEGRVRRAGVRVRVTAQAAVDELNAQADHRYVSPYNVSRVYAAAGESEPAFACLERACGERNPDLIELNAEPVFDRLRPDPRFADFLHRVGWRG